jgi:hypothetical protein
MHHDPGLDHVREFASRSLTPDLDPPITLTCTEHERATVHAIGAGLCTAASGGAPLCRGVVLAAACDLIHLLEAERRAARERSGLEAPRSVAADRTR